MLNIQITTIMKQIIMTLTALFALLLNSNAMSYEQARREALFLTDKMAYELNLNDAQYEAAFEINLDYLMGITTPDDLYGPYWTRRNLDMSYVLFDWQWSAFQTALYFYRPLTWHAGNWHFGIYARYPHRNYFYFSAPHVYISYCGGHSWRNNGGRSYYYHHRNHYISHSDKHWGMKDRWDRGDFKGSHNHGNNHGNRPGFRMDKVDNDRIHGGNFGGNNDRNNHFNGGNNNDRNHGGNFGNGGNRPNRTDRESSTRVTVNSKVHNRNQQAPGTFRPNSNGSVQIKNNQAISGSSINRPSGISGSNNRTNRNSISLPTPSVNRNSGGSSINRNNGISGNRGSMNGNRSFSTKSSSTRSSNHNSQNDRGGGRR